MNIPKVNSRYGLQMILIGFLMLSFLSCIKGLTKRKFLYDNDFEKGSIGTVNIYNANGLAQGNFIETFNNTKVLGRFFNNYVEFESFNLPRHFAIQVEFDLYIHDEWQGDSSLSIPGTPDLWNILVDGNPELVTTFSNTRTWQSYPLFFGAGQPPSRPGVNAVRTDLPGACLWKDRPNGTTQYHIVKTYEHTAKTLRIALQDNLKVARNTTSPICNKSWSVDNVRISSIDR